MKSQDLDELHEKWGCSEQDVCGIENCWDSIVNNVKKYIQKKTGDFDVYYYWELSVIIASKAVMNSDPSLREIQLLFGIVLGGNYTASEVYAAVKYLSQIGVLVQKDYRVIVDGSVSNEIFLMGIPRKNGKRKCVTTKDRFRVFRNDGFRCVSCGRSPEDGAKLQVDHIIPVSRGGKNRMSNYQTLCQDCNLGKMTDTVCVKTAIAAGS